VTKQIGGGKVIMTLWVLLLAYEIMGVQNYHEGILTPLQKHFMFF
jgi:hypothetical protein